MKVKNWKKFQHFKDRCPPWIKLHREILDQRDIMMISACSFRLLTCLWLLASEDENKAGELPEIEDISFRLRMPVVEIIPLLQELLPWLEDSDISAISARYQDGPPETETETETYKPEKEKEKEKTTTSAAVKKLSILEFQDLMSRYLGKLMMSGGQIELIRSLCERYTPEMITTAFERGAGASPPAKHLNWIVKWLEAPENNVITVEEDNEFTRYYKQCLEEDRGRTVHQTGA